MGGRKRGWRGGEKMKVRGEKGESEKVDWEVRVRGRTERWRVRGEESGRGERLSWRERGEKD